MKEILEFVKSLNKNVFEPALRTHPEVRPQWTERRSQERGSDSCASVFSIKGGDQMKVPEVLGQREETGLRQDWWARWKGSLPVLGGRRVADTEKP